MTDLPPTPGWYPDPWYPGVVRWFDGTQWTDHAAASGGPPGVGYAEPYDGAKGASTARWAGYAFVVRGVLTAFQLVVAPMVFARTWNEFFDAIADPETLDTFNSSGFETFSLLSQVASLVTYGCLAALCVWSFRATKNARILGLTTSFSPGWAVAAWLIPLANIVMPLFVLRDLVPQDHPARRRAFLWWGFEIGGVVIGMSGYIVAIAVGIGAGTAVGCVAGTLAIIAAVLGFRITREVPVLHDTFASGPGQG